MGALKKLSLAIQDVIDNYDNWMDVLENGSIQDQVEIIDDLRDAYGDLLDIDGSSLSKSFSLRSLSIIFLIIINL